MRFSIYLSNICIVNLYNSYELNSFHDDTYFVLCKDVQKLQEEKHYFNTCVNTG